MNKNVHTWGAELLVSDFFLFPPALIRHLCKDTIQSDQAHDLKKLTCLGFSIFDNSATVMPFSVNSICNFNFNLIIEHYS